jgi:hypothetical protein
MIVGVFPTIRRWRAVRYAALTTLFIFTTLPYQPVSAYQTTLDSRTIGEAYVLGQRNDKVTADFVAPYISQVTQEGLDGLHRADIELLTPFLQIVDRSKDNSKGYSVEQAAADYRARRTTRRRRRTAPRRQLAITPRSCRRISGRTFSSSSNKAGRLCIHHRLRTNPSIQRPRKMQLPTSTVQLYGYSSTHATLLPDNLKLILSRLIAKQSRQCSTWPLFVNGLGAAFPCVNER